MADDKIKVKTELALKLEMVKQEVAVTCVLCGQEGHMGKDCVEVVCILCFARGHLMDQCMDIVIVDEVGAEAIKNQGETTSVSVSEQQPVIRLKNMDLLLENKKLDNSPVSLEENELPLPKRSRRDAAKEEEEKFHRVMIRKFGDSTPPDVVSLFKEKYCGLCCTKFSCEKFAWKHYNGKGHESLIRKKTFRNRPLFWQMVFHALISVEPNGATKDEIFEFILETFSAHLSDNSKQVRAEMDKTIKDMVERFHNVINVEGVFKLRDRKPSDAPKPVPDGLVEKSKYIGSFGKEKTLIKSGFSNFERHLSEKLKGREGVKREDGRDSRRDKDLERHGDRERSERKRGCSGDRSHRRGEERRNYGGKDREEKCRKRRKERSSSSRRTKRLRSSHRDRSRSNKRNSSSSKDSPTGKKPVYMPPASLSLELPVMFTSNSMTFSPVTQAFSTPTPVMAGYPSNTCPTYMTMPIPVMADSLASFYSGNLIAPQGHSALLTPPPTPGDV